ncbi:LacI family DNA-binding transcriptional regulator [Paludibacter jiangxiensis]|uniref:Regulatory protein, lacI family n=1 Tax=Paludibacter jiangxiensis TaxID=681398 RepID=A0A171AVW3_9BACT|nr:LacI family DNA-binding transcriptional regulator [Paludibacter jiangxiensis]GAT64351.1 regulatory protein, lacI family [Paludibacter jiangxiensis]
MNERLKQVKELLPHGGMKVIAQKANVSIPTVCRVLNGFPSPQMERIVTCTAEYLAEVKEKEKNINAVLEKALQS